MAHELDFSTGRAAIAVRGGAATTWHGFGETITDDDDIPAILVKAGLSWTAHKAPVHYTAEATDGAPAMQFRNVSVCYRSDTGEALGTVSDNRYQIVQPATILEFFREFLRWEGLSIETAGALKGGRVVWCLANLGPEFRHLGPGGDTTQGYVRLQTSYDGSRVTSLVGTTIRQVCANTERMIESETARQQYRVAHSTQLDAKALHAAFGFLGADFRETAETWNALQARTVTDEQAREFFCQVAGINPDDLTRNGADGKPLVSGKSRNALQALADAYRASPGANLPGARGTAYGLLNAVTYYADHVATVRDTASDGTTVARLASAWLGSGADMKARARAYAAELAGLKVAA